MARSKTSSYTITFEILLTDKQAHIAEHYRKVGIQIYNRILNECLKRLHKVQHDKDIRSLLESLKEASDKERDRIKKEIRIIEQSYGYSEYDMHSFAAEVKHYFKDVIGIDECQTLATRAFNAVQKVHYHEAEKVHFKTYFEEFSIEGKSKKSTLHINGDDTISFKDLKHIPLVVKKKDMYAMETFKDRTKYVRLLFRTVRGKRRYFVQLVKEGLPPSKGRFDDAPDNRVGIDLGVSTAAVVSKGEVHLYELAGECAMDEKKLRRIQRAMDRSKRATNPDNYNPDGSVKKKAQLKKWKYSRRYLKLRDKRRELYRKLAVKRKASHEALANRIIASGTDIRIEDMCIRAMQKRSKKTSKRTDGRNNSKRRFGKTISKRAPAMFVSILKRKLAYLGKELADIDTRSVKASQFDHTDNSYKRKPLNQRYAKLGNGDVVQRDLYSGFLICYTDGSLASVDIELCKNNYNNFLTLQNEEVDRIRNSKNNSLLWYVAYAS